MPHTNAASAGPAPRCEDETAFLLRSRSNRDRLTAAIAEHRTGQPGVSFTSWDEMEARIDSPDA